MEPMIKGYAIVSASKFVLEHPALQRKVSPAVLSEINRNVPTYKPTEWYPRSRAMQVYDAVAKAASSEAEAYELLAACGTASAEAAVQGYLKLLLKVLTARMFASKFPDFWARDHQSGHATVEMPTSTQMLFHLNGVGGFDHIGPVSMGFIRYAVQAMGMKGLEAKCSPWSLTEPGPDAVTVDVTWA